MVPTYHHRGDTCNIQLNSESQTSIDQATDPSSYIVDNFCGRMKGFAIGYDGSEDYISSIVLYGKRDLDDPSTDFSKNELKATAYKFPELQDIVEFFNSYSFDEELGRSDSNWVNTWDANINVCLTDIKAHIYSGKQTILGAETIELKEGDTLKVGGTVESVPNYVRKSKSADKLSRKIEELELSLERTKSQRDALKAQITIGE